MFMSYMNLSDWLGIIKYEDDPNTYFDYQCSHKARVRSKNKNIRNKNHRRKIKRK